MEPYLLIFGIMIIFNKQFFIIFLSLLFVSGCSENEMDYANEKANVIYAKADEYYKKKDFKKAAKFFSEIERNHPYSDLSIKGQIMSAYSYYLANQYEESTESYNVFMQLHPGHEKVPYALYMRGICAYEQIPIVQRDQEIAVEALNFFIDLSERFPKSIYAKDAKEKCEKIRDHLAAKEMDVALYYMKTYAYISAINRLNSVIDNYKTSRQTPEAYYRLVESYKALGIIDQAKYYDSILQKTYASNSWAIKSKEILKK